MLPSPLMACKNYTFSAELLYKIFESLVDDKRFENLHYGSGIQIGNTIVPTAIIKPKLAGRSAIYVEADTISIVENCLTLDRFGQAIVYSAHLHPGKGRFCTQPSSIDINTHIEYEMCYPIIGVIFVRDGCFSFFSAKRPFNVKIYGQGVKRLGRNSYRFSE